MTGGRDADWYASEDPNYLMHGMLRKNRERHSEQHLLSTSCEPCNSHHGHLIVIISFNSPFKPVVGIFVPIL